MNLNERDRAMGQGARVLVSQWEPTTHKKKHFGGNGRTLQKSMRLGDRKKILQGPTPTCYAKCLCHILAANNTCKNLHINKLLNSMCRKLHIIHTFSKCVLKNTHTYQELSYDTKNYDNSKIQQ